MIMTTRYEVTRTNGREVEIVRGLTLREARRIVERDRNAGYRSIMTEARPSTRKTYR